MTSSTQAVGAIRFRLDGTKIALFGSEEYHLQRARRVFLVLTLLSAFLSVTAYGWQARIPPDEPGRLATDTTKVPTPDTAGIAREMTQVNLTDQRDVIDVLKGLFNLDITGRRYNQERERDALRGRASRRGIFVEHEIRGHDRGQRRDLYR